MGVGTVSVETDLMPRQKGYVRAYQDSIAIYEQMEDNATTGWPQMMLTIVFRIDLNDSVIGGGGGGGGIGSGGTGGYVPM